MTTRPGSMPITKLSTLTKPPPPSLRSRTNKRFLTWRSFILRTQSLFLQKTVTQPTGLNLLPPNRSLAQVRLEPLSELWFTASFPAKVHTNHRSNSKDGVLKTTSEPGSPGSGKDHKTPDERTLKLGQTLQTLSPLLPTIFTSPLSNDLLSPAVSLHLFPSTHPHLPVVKSRVPCRAALWTAPMAWGSVPIVGNVRVEILSEKMVRTGFVSAPTSTTENHVDGMGEEKLVVRWKTEDKKNGNGNGEAASPASAQSLSSSGSEINRGLSTMLGGSQPLFSKDPSDQFTGLFIFSFDKDGKIASLTIEHADESQGFDKTSKVVTLTDWLLGKARWGRVEGGLVPGLAYRGNGPEVLCRENTNAGDRLAWRRKGH